MILTSSYVLLYIDCIKKYLSLRRLLNSLGQWFILQVCEHVRHSELYQFDIVEIKCLNNYFASVLIFIARKGHVIA